MSNMGAPLAFEFTRRPPSQRMAGLIAGMTGYRETALGRFSQRETAPLVVPLIISVGTPFLIALGRQPGAADRQASFAAGLHVGPVYIESDGGAECVQVDFTPLGAYRFFGGVVVDLAARMVDIGDVLGREGRQLRERLGATLCWQQRFDLLDDFIACRVNHLPSPEISFAYRRLARTAGGARITALAGEIGQRHNDILSRQLRLLQVRIDENANRIDQIQKFLGLLNRRALDNPYSTASKSPPVLPNSISLWSELQERIQSDTNLVQLSEQTVVHAAPDTYLVASHSLEPLRASTRARLMSGRHLPFIGIPYLAFSE